MELSLGIFAILPLIILLILSLVDGGLERRFLTLSYMAGQLLCWTIGVLGCFYFIPHASHNYPVGSYELSMILVNLITWSSLIAGLIAVPFQKNQKQYQPFTTLPTQQTACGLKLTAILSILFLCANYYAGKLYAYANFGNQLEEVPTLYILHELRILQYLFFFFMGTQLHSVLLSLRNIILMGILLFSILLVNLTGTREMGVQALLFFLGGGLYAVNFKQIIKLFLGLGLFAIVFFIIIGFARSENFFDSNIDSRLQRIWQELTTSRSHWLEYGKPFFFRVSEDLVGQLVIHNVTERSQFIGIENFERITNIFLPTFILQDTLPIDDGPERLRDHHALPISNFYTANITFLADSFERGSYAFVLATSFLLSYWLGLFGRYLHHLENPVLKAMMLIAFAYTSFRLYPHSVLRVINIMTYEFIRDMILIGSVSSLMGIMVNSYSTQHTIQQNKPTS